MSDEMTFPKTADEFMEQYKIVDTEQVYTNGAELIPIFRMKQWFEHAVKHGEWKHKMLDNFRKYEVVCSECGARYVGNYDAYDEPYDFKYCPNCGTEMETYA